MRGENKNLLLQEKIKTRDKNRLTLFQRDGDSCIWCSKVLDSKAPHSCPTFDHVITKDAGGSNWIGNLVLSCAKCNRKRSNRSMQKWKEICLQKGKKVREDIYVQALKRVDPEKSYKEMQPENSL